MIYKVLIVTETHEIIGEFLAGASIPHSPDGVYDLAVAMDGRALIDMMKLVIRRRDAKEAMKNHA